MRGVGGRCSRWKSVSVERGEFLGATLDESFSGQKIVAAKQSAVLGSVRRDTSGAAERLLCFVRWVLASWARSTATAAGHGWLFALTRLGSAKDDKGDRYNVWSSHRDAQIGSTQNGQCRRGFN